MSIKSVYVIVNKCFIADLFEVDYIKEFCSALKIPESHRKKSMYAY